MAFDVIVVGGGHAGCEAAAAAARLGRRVALVTHRADAIGRLSCNPAIGGLAKGHLVREIDALGGLMGRVADATCIQFRHLNTRKGLAVRSSRAQVDIDAYPEVMQRELARLTGLTVVEGEATGVRVSGGRVVGLTVGERTLDAPAVILTTGTFLGGLLHCGDEQVEGGRRGEAASNALAHSLRDLGLRTQRLKTGTVPRLRADTVDWGRLEVQHDTVPDGRFSFRPVPRPLPPITCHVAWTHEEVHDLVRDNLHRSPMYTGRIEGRGPRYCPSIEDKIVRFADRDRHRLFLEPEGHRTDRIYVNGLSTSLPAEVQEAMVHAIPGLEHAEIVQHGYAVEYDVADPRDLDHGLQRRDLPGLFLAGQVNGTSGYEEAAAQGLVAGISAATGQPFRVRRDQAYLGVLVDDLVTRGVGGEPYRMFTSRAEHRLLLREDNADRRLMPLGRSLGLVDDQDWADFEARERQRRDADQRLDVPFRADQTTRARLRDLGLDAPTRPVTLRELLRRPEARWEHLRVAHPDLPALDPEVEEQVTIDVRYEGYIDRARRRAEAAARMEEVQLPRDVDWHAVPSLTTEVRERLTAARPASLGAASRLIGVTPAAVTAIAAWLTASRGSRREDSTHGA